MTGVTVPRTRSQQWNHSMIGLLKAVTDRQASSRTRIIAALWASVVKEKQTACRDSSCFSKLFETTACI